MERVSYLTWWWGMIKRWCLYWGIVGFIQVVFWLVPEPFYGQSEKWVRYGSIVILTVPFVFWIPYKVWRRAKPGIVKEQEENPNAYISTHICSVSTWPITTRQGDFINLTICFCNSLFYEVELTSLSGNAKINGKIDGELPQLTEIKGLKLDRGFTTKELKLNATSCFADELKMAVSSLPMPKPIKIELNLIGYDNKGKKYAWSPIYGDSK